MTFAQTMQKLAFVVGIVLLAILCIAFPPLAIAGFIFWYVTADKSKL